MKFGKIILVFFVVALLSFDGVDYNTEANKDYILNKVNTLRASGCYCDNIYMPPASPLKWDKDLYKSAMAHAVDMNKYQYFSHFSKRGEDIGDRLDRYGYQWQVAGENLGEGQKNFNEVLSDWKNSSSHCKMLMNPKVVDMAVARLGRYWVQHFGRRLPKGAVVINK